MNGYLIVKGQAHSPHKRGKQAESFRTSPPVSSLKAHNTGSISKVFLIFSGQNRWIPVLSDICTPPYLRFVRM